MGESRDRGWVKQLLFGGLGVTAFTFLAPIVWERISHRTVGPDQVNAMLRVEEGVLLLLVRNNSSDPLDLVEAEIEIDGIANVGEELGAYPAPSHLYQVDSRSAAEVRQQDGRLIVRLKIAQAIDPGKIDQFGFRIKGPTGSLTPTVGSLNGKIMDVRGNVYRVKY